MHRDDITLRRATADDVDAVARIWHRGWQDAHLGHVPDELTAVRTKESFWTRAAEHVGDTTVAVVDGRVAGFTMVVGDEVEQMYVSDEHRGAGVADVLLDAAERRVRDGGHETAWLAVIAENPRARRFYARHGWVDRGPFEHAAPGPDGPITVPSHRYEKIVISRDRA